ncbi:MAG: alcohol dehydrogenase [Verrucomicrobia bacterium]|nr:MAG: alcohol dehydrogenase [Verrucomicrobiota bacterium]
MRAMVLYEQGKRLRSQEVERPEAGRGQVLIEVGACAVCRTDLHVADGELKEPKLPLVLGHEIVGRVAGLGEEAKRLNVGDRVGVPWLGWTCGKCGYCKTGRENLCDFAKFTGYTLDGGYAQYTVADERFCFRIPEAYSDAEAAPLLCAGLIGYRSLRMTGEAKRVGTYGFGAAAHLITQVAAFQGREIFAFTRTGDERGQEFARRLGAVWAGGSEEMPPEKLDAAIIFAPAGELVPMALKAVAKGGRVVCGGIHMSAIPSFEYDLLWEERSVCSVANLTRRDGAEFFEIAPRVPVKSTVQAFRLEQANEALEMLRRGRIEGAAVLIP